MGISRVGFAELRLCTGHVPMYKEMVMLAKPLIELLIHEYGLEGVVKRFSNPYWFQSLALAMGFEHNYTGATTVTIKAIKESINNEDLGIKVVGGKGKEGVSLPQEVESMVKRGEVDESFAHEFVNKAREAAKSDNSLLQDSFDIYFHSAIISEDGAFAIINQGMNEKEGLVRRYHWEQFKDLFKSNKSSSNSYKLALRMDRDKREEKEVRKSIMDMVKDYTPKQLERKALLLRREMKILNTGQKQLFLKMFDKIRDVPYYLYFPKRLNAKALEVAREAENFKEFFTTPGIGKSTMRGLAYLSSLIYGTELSWENPQKYCYAFGTKASKPWYVEREEMRKAASVLREVLEGLEVEREKKREVLRRLGRLV